MRLMIDSSATPTAHHSPIPVPIHWQDAVKAGLDRDVRLGVLEPIVSQYGHLCQAKWHTQTYYRLQTPQCPRHQRNTPQPITLPPGTSSPSGEKEESFDAWNGYHSVPLHPDDQHYTTFITPWGCCRYRTAPQGYIASGDGYTRRYDEITSSIPNKTKCVDETLQWSKRVFQAANWLDTCGRHGITLNPEKFRFAQDEVEFAGFKITNDTIQPCKRYIRAIADFPTPWSLTDIRSWFGLVNQISYAFSMADAMLPFREL